MGIKTRLGLSFWNPTGMDVNTLNQFIQFLKSEVRLFWVIFIACTAVLGLDYYFAELLSGLPVWALPMILIMWIFFGVWAICVIIISAYTHIIAWSGPFFRRKKIRDELLKLKPQELIYLCVQLAKCEREIIGTNPDYPIYVTLVDKGLLKHKKRISKYYELINIHEIPLDVWRFMLIMDEFSMVDGEKLLHIRGKLADTSKNFKDEHDKLSRQLLDLLPQKHPAVMSVKKTLQSAPQC